MKLLSGILFLPHLLGHILILLDNQLDQRDPLRPA
jgi:hypothetical protein